MLLEKKIHNNSIAAGLASALTMAAVAVAKKFGFELDPLVAAPVVAYVVVHGITFLVGYVTKHTNRPDLADDVEEALGIEDAHEHLDETSDVDEAADQREVL